MIAETFGSKTKIIATLGPSSDSEDVIEKLILSGVDVFRLNFSHGSYADHKRRLELVRKLSVKHKKPLAVIQDLCGPKIRLGSIRERKLNLKDIIVLGSAEFPISHPEILKELKTDDLIYVDDGKIILQVKNNDDGLCLCECIREGIVSSHKGLNFRSKEISLNALTAKDISDLDFAIKENVDFIALSFVKKASDINILRMELLQKGKNLPIIAKIEKYDALVNLESIVDIADAILIARGDLGVEIMLEELPLAQIKIIKLCRQKGKPVIVATQMMESMVYNPLPTRAEVNDIATSIVQGADAIMFSSETAIGKYPIEVIFTANKIIMTTESGLEKDLLSLDNYQVYDQDHIFIDAISLATCVLAEKLKANLLIVPTETGNTARRIARFRPTTKIIAFTTNENISRQLCLVWGVQPITTEPVGNVDELFIQAQTILYAKGLINHGDTIIFTSGAKIGLAGCTNTVHFHKVGSQC